VGRIAYAEETGGGPFEEAVDLNGKQLDLVPGVDLDGAAGEEGNDALDALLEGGKTFLLDCGEGVFGDDVADLEVVVAIDEDDEAAVVDVSESIFRVRGLTGDLEPEDIDRDADVLEWEVASVAGDGVAAVAADGQGGGDFDWTVGCVGTHAGGEAVLLDETGSLPAHAQSKGGKAACLFGEEIEEVPLRHEGDEFAVGGDVGEIGYWKALTADDGGECCDLGVRDGEELFKEA